MSKKEKKITRKDFLKKSGAGLTGLFAISTFKGRPLNLFNSAETSFETRILGRTGIKVTTVGFGAARIMEPALVRAAVDHGINFIDTGRSYSNGTNEIMVGNTLKDIRKNVVIQSKIRVRFPKNKTENPSQRIKKNMDLLLNESLKALQTDYIDILLVHSVSDVKVIKNESVQEFLSSAKEKGQIRAHGFSSHNEIDLLEFANESLFYDVVMVPYNHKGAYKHMLSGRTLEWDQPNVEIELEKAYKNNLGIVAMKTCSAGPYSHDNTDKPSYGKALKWVLDHDFVHTAAAAMTNLSQIKENVRVMAE